MLKGGIWRISPFGVVVYFSELQILATDGRIRHLCPTDSGQICRCKTSVDGFIQMSVLANAHSSLLCGRGTEPPEVERGEGEAHML